FLFLTILLIVALFFSIRPASAGALNHLVITEIQSAGQISVDDEFIELYNPTNQAIDLTGYILKKKTNSGNENTLVAASRFSGKTIASQRYLLLARQDKYQGQILPDIFWPSSYNLSPDNTLLLYDASGGIIDKVGWGSAVDFEGSAISNSETGKSLERRKDNNNFYLDTDNNNQDFFIQNNPNPQNSSYQPSTAPSGPVCGNGILEANEACDDGNMANNDGCSAFCQVEQSSGGGEENNPAPVIKITPEPLYQVQPSDVVINEIFPEPDAQKGETEWIELYNHTKHSFDLADWIIEDNTQRPQSLAGLTIPAYNFLLITKGEHFNFTLNNGGDILILKKANNIIDQIAYGDFEDGNVANNAPRPGLSKSIGRNTGKTDTNDDKKDFFITEKPTPRENNILQSLIYLADPDSRGEEGANEQASSYKIFISEIFPNSSGQDKDKEWLEIYNKGDEPVNLANWQLIGGLNYSKKYTFPENSKILAKTYLVLKDSDLKFTLRNKSENILLIDGQGRTIDKISYQDAPEEMSLVRNSDGEIMWSATPTPGKENLFINPDDIDEEETEGTDGQSIKNPTTLDHKQEELISGDYKYMETAEFRDLKNGSRAEARGIVIAQPGILNSQTFYINGLAIYSYYKNFPKLEIGDEISVRGVKSTYSGAPRLKISASADIKILSRQKKVPPIDLNDQEADESLLGRLVKISGMVVERTSNNLYLATEDSEILVDLSLLKNLKKSLIKEKREITATGILMSRGGDLLVKPFDEKQLEIKDEKQLELEVEPLLNLNSKQGDLSLSDSEPSSEQSGTYSNNRKTTKYLTFSAASLVLVSLLVFLLRFKLF
ncbi:MAG: lamin tail domain-containing protein, partial [Patescibacteria group bacterium]